MSLGIHSECVPDLCGPYIRIFFEAHENGLADITYQTKEQTGLHDNFDTNDVRFWMAPEYREGKWKVPVMAQTSGSAFPSGNEFDQESAMRGEWLKVTMRHSLNEELYIKNVITNFEVSQF